MISTAARPYIPVPSSNRINPRGDEYSPAAIRKIAKIRHALGDTSGGLTICPRFFLRFDIWGYLPFYT